MKFTLFAVVFFYSALGLSCLDFSYKDLVCVDSRSAQVTSMKQFSLVNRPDYKVVVSEVGPRLRTLILPFTQVYPNGMEYTLDCRGETLVTEQRFDDQVASTKFIFEGPDVVVQRGEIFSFSECANCTPEKVPFEIVCTRRGF